MPFLPQRNLGKHELAKPLSLFSYTRHSVTAARELTCGAAGPENCLQEPHGIL